MYVISEHLSAAIQAVVYSGGAGPPRPDPPGSKMAPSSRQRCSASLIDRRSLRLGHNLIYILCCTCVLCLWGLENWMVV